MEEDGFYSKITITVLFDNLEEVEEVTESIFDVLEDFMCPDGEDENHICKYSYTIGGISGKTEELLDD